MDARWAGMLHWVDLLLILFVLWVVSLICGPRRKAGQGRREREELERWSARSVRMDLTDAEWEELQDAR